MECDPLMEAMIAVLKKKPPQSCQLLSVLIFMIIVLLVDGFGDVDQL